MPTIRASATALVDAPPPAVYAVLADYREGHPSILPPASFSDLVVEQGGTGEGTVIRFTVRVGGTARRVRAAVTEPQPGRVLHETDLDTGSVTCFLVEPAAGGRSRVTFETTWSTPGIRGWIERLMAPRLLERVYSEELRNLEAVARSTHAATAGS
jgi:hypothetical protein